MIKPDVVVVGEIYIDHIFSGFAAWPGPGEEVFTPYYTHEIGGGAANTACALARLGRPVRLVGVIGAVDAPWVEGRLAQFGVSGEGLTRLPGKTGVTVSVSTRDDRSFFTYVGENAKLTDQLYREPVLASLTQARHVHFALPLDREIAAHLLPVLREAGCTTSLDVGHQTEWLRDPVNLETCRAIDYLLPNEREASLLCGADASQYLAFARRIGLPRGVVKLGARGAAMVSNGTRYDVPPPHLEAVDTTGAGDAFDAGFIDALLDGASPTDCLRRGCICGGLSTRVAGALCGLPHRQEVEALYEQTYVS